MLTVQNLQKSYPGFSLDCSLALQPGRITGLLGPNGAGKSTTFKAILGLIRPDGGRICLLGTPLEHFTPAQRQQLGVVLAESTFSLYLTLGDICGILAGFYPAFDRAFFHEQALRFGLPLNKPLRTLSTGMKAKAKLLCAMSHQPRLLILDEPTAGLDVIARQEVLDLLRRFMEADPSRSILISSHISSDLETLCDDVYLISGGRVVLHEDTDALLSRYGLLKLTRQQYGGLDKTYILRQKQEPLGVLALTDQRQFYAENYPDVLQEPGSIDRVITMMIQGDAP